MQKIRAKGFLFFFFLALASLSIGLVWRHYRPINPQTASPSAPAAGRDISSAPAVASGRPSPKATVSDDTPETTCPSPVAGKDPVVPARPGVVPAPAVASSPDEIAEELAAFVAMARDASIDANEREERIMEWGQQGDSRAARALMALGDEDTYLNFAAIHALASMQHPEVAAYLAQKLTHGDPRMIAAAAASLAAVQGAAAIPSIAETLRQNRLRADGQQDVVCAACVEALKQIGDASALSALAAELDKTVGVSLSYNYGSRIVSAIREIGDPSGLAILRSYADRLRERKARSAGSPKAEHFLQSEINKTVEAMAHLEKGRG